MYIHFQQNWVNINPVKTVHTNLFAKNCMQLEFQKITLFGHALPHNRHSGQCWDQSAR